MQYPPPPQPPPEHSPPPYAPDPQLPPQYPNPPYPIQPPAYGYYAPIYPPAPRQQVSAFAIASLVTSILSWFVIPFVGGIVAVVLGHIAHNEIRKANGAIGGRGMALAGLILGYVQIVFTILAIVIVIWLIIVFSDNPTV